MKQLNFGIGVSDKEKTVCNICSKEKNQTGGGYSCACVFYRKAQQGSRISAAMDPMGSGFRRYNFYSHKFHLSGQLYSLFIKKQNVIFNVDFILKIY